MQSALTTFRFSLSTLFATTAYFALLLGVWKHVGWEWVKLLSGLLFILVVLCATKVWRRTSIICPVCRQRIHGMLFCNRTPCPKCGAELQDVHWASVRASWVFTVVVGLLLLGASTSRKIPGPVPLLSVVIGSTLLLGLAVKYYTQAKLADEPQELPREWILKVTRLSPEKFWLIWEVASTLLSVAIPIILVERQNPVLGIGMLFFLLIALNAIGFFLYFAVLDLFLFRPVRVHNRGEFYPRSCILSTSLIATLATLHFCYGTTLWLMYMIGTDAFPLSDALPIAWICFVLLGLSILTLVQSLRRRKMASWLVVVLLVSSALGFWYDATHRRFQISRFIKNTGKMVDEATTTSIGRFTTQGSQTFKRHKLGVYLSQEPTQQEIP